MFFGTWTVSNALTIGGSSTITGNGCGLMSNTDVKYNGTPNFSGPGWAVNAVEGCKASAGHCDVGVPHNYNMLPATNPLQGTGYCIVQHAGPASTKPCVACYQWSNAVR